MTSKKSRKAFVAEVKKMTDPEQPVMRTLKPDVDQFGEVVKFDASKYFLPLEESNYLMDTMGSTSYATYITDDPELFEGTLENGFYHPDTGAEWQPFFPFWREREGRMFMAPAGSGIDSLEKVGIITKMESPADFMKTAKMVNRLLIPLPAMTEAVWGDLVSFNAIDETAIIKLQVPDNSGLEDDESVEISVRFVSLKDMTPDQKALADGSFLYSEKFARLAGMGEPSVGDAIRGTFGFPVVGSAKGHGAFKPGLDVDLVIYGPKTYVLTKRFYFGNLGPLKASMRPKTDPQAVTNFGFYRPGLMLDQAIKYMHSVWESGKDEDQFRARILRHSQDMVDVDLDNESWILPKCLQFGISLLAYPGPYRRAVSYLAGSKSPVFQCDSRMRVPLDGVAIYAYVAMDPNAVDSEGVITPKDSPIPAGHCVMPDLPEGTEIVAYRQPSENSNAHVFLKVWHSPEYDRYKGRGLVLLGQGASPVMLRLGGADQDDMFMLVYHPTWVAAFKTLRPYPETGKINADDVQVDDNSVLDEDEYNSSEFISFTDSLMADILDGMKEYNNRHAAWQVEMAKNGGAGLGTAVNWGSLDMVLSDPDHKASMLADLEERGLGNSPHAQWLRGYDPYQAAVVMTNLEIVIDGTVKDPTLLKPLQAELDKIAPWHEDCMVYPESMASKIPKSRREPEDGSEPTYVLAKSLICRTLEKIGDVRQQLLEAFQEREWMLVRPANDELRDMYPRDKEISRLVGGEYKWDPTEERMTRIDDTITIRQRWAESWKEELSEDKDHTGAYERICSEIEEMLWEYDTDKKLAIAVELYYQTYRRYEVTPQYDEQTGRIQNFRDGLLWSPVFTDLFINALRHARLSGMYKPVEIRPEFRHRILVKHAKDSILVMVKEGSVYIQDEDGNFTVWVGLIMGRSWNGRFRMVSGMVEFRKGSDICQPDDMFQPPAKAMAYIIRQAKSDIPKDLPLKDKAMKVLDNKVKEAIEKGKK